MVAMFALAQANLESQLSSQIRSAAPGPFGNLGAFVRNIQTAHNAQTVHVSTNNINSLLHSQRTLVVSGHHVTFAPFQDLGHLKFGTRYHKLHMDHSIRIPGHCYSKVTAAIGERQGTQVTYRTAYGAAVGSGQSLTHTVMVRVCKKRFLGRTKCRMVPHSVPRGVNMHELEQATRGLDHIAFHAVASASGRLLRMVHKFKKNNVAKHNFSKLSAHDVQELKGVPKASILEAVYSLIGERVPVSKTHLFAGKTIRVSSKNRTYKEISAKKARKGYTIQVHTVSN